MKKIIIVFLVIIGLFVSGYSYFAFYSGRCSWNYEEKTKILTITEEQDTTPNEVYLTYPATYPPKSRRISIYKYLATLTTSYSWEEQLEEKKEWKRK